MLLPCNVIHPRSGRTLPQPLLQLIDRCRIAAGNDFDAAIRKVFRVTAEPKLQRFTACAGAKEHTLHFAAYQKARAAHTVNDQWPRSATPV
jgi:hypothetical protein